MAREQKPFWEMSKGEVDAWTALSGLELWKEKIAADRAKAPDLLARGPNPWLPGQENPKLQNIIAQLAPALAERMRRQADGAAEGAD